MARKVGSHSDITGPKVRKAALTLFARHGFAAVSMRQIAAEVGLQAGALYLYTPDKQSLLADLMVDHLEELLAALAELPAQTDPAAALAAFAHFHIRFHLERPDAVFIAYMELRNLSPENFARVEALRQRYEQALADILADGAGQGVFAFPDLKLATLALIAMLTGVTTWYRPGGRLDPQAIGAIYGQMALRSVAATGSFADRYPPPT